METVGLEPMTSTLPVSRYTASVALSQLSYAPVKTILIILYPCAKNNFFFAELSPVLTLPENSRYNGIVGSIFWHGGKDET